MLPEACTTEQIIQSNVLETLMKSACYFQSVTVIMAVKNDARESLFNNVILLVTNNSVMFTIISLEALGKSLITDLTFN